MATIAIVSPVRPQSTSGNAVTADRWARLLETAESAPGQSGHPDHRATVVHLDEQDTDLPPGVRASLERADVMVALHGRRSAAAVRWWRSQEHQKPLIVAMTGTDLYVDLPDEVATRESVELADALIVLQSKAVERLGTMNSRWADKAVVVNQSLAGPHPARVSADGEFRVVVLAHLRSVKDPLLSARAARHLPAESTVTVHHAGGGIDATLVGEAKRERSENLRYHWHGDLDRDAARRLLATAHVLACTSLSEGGANVVTEAIALGVPVIGTNVDGNVGLLGPDHPGLVPVGDDRALGELLHRLETDMALLAELQRRTDERQSLTDPTTEQATLLSLIDRLR